MPIFHFLLSKLGYHCLKLGVFPINVLASVGTKSYQVIASDPREYNIFLGWRDDWAVKMALYTLCNSSSTVYPTSCSSGNYRLFHIVDLSPLLTDKMDNGTE